MTDANCFRVRKETVKRRIFVATSLPGIPRAPVRKGKVRDVDIYFEERKRTLGHKLPIYTLEEIHRIGHEGHPLHMVILLSLRDSGYLRLVKEITEVLKKEETEIIPNARYINVAPFLSLPDTFKLFAETLKFCEDLLAAGKYEHVITLRTELAVKMMQEDLIWLARYILLGTLDLTHRFAEPLRSRFQAEISCLLAFLIRVEFDKHADDEVPIVEALTNLRECRNLCIGETWHFRPGVIKFTVKKPLTFHGLRHAEEHTIDGCLLSVYMTASLLEHEMLFELAHKILFRHDTALPLEDDVVLSLQYAYDALQLAMEVREPESLSCALIRFGLILRDSGEYLEAMTFFEQLQMHAEMRPDKETEAVSFYLLGTCFNGQLDPVNALEMFALESETGRDIADLEAEAAAEMGKTLLCEGQTLEAQDCFHLASRRYAVAAALFGTPTERLDDTWIYDGISHGQHMWGQLAGLGRRTEPLEMRAIIRHKLRREPLPRVRRPLYDIPSAAAVVQQLAKEDLNFFNNREKVGTKEETPTTSDQKSDAKGDGHESKTASSKEGLKAISFHLDSNNSQHSKALPGTTRLSQFTDATDFSEDKSHSGSSSSPQTIFDVDMMYASDVREEKLIPTTSSKSLVLDDLEDMDGKGYRKSITTRAVHGTSHSHSFGTMHKINNPHSLSSIPARPKLQSIHSLHSINSIKSRHTHISLQSFHSSHHPHQQHQHPHQHQHPPQHPGHPDIRHAEKKSHQPHTLDETTAERVKNLDKAPVVEADSFRLPLQQTSLLGIPKIPPKKT